MAGGSRGRSLRSLHAGRAALLHMWSSEQVLVRRVLRVAEESRESRLTRSQSASGIRGPRNLNLLPEAMPRETRRVDREQFSGRLRRILSGPFSGRNRRFAGILRRPSPFAFRLVYAGHVASGFRSLSRCSPPHLEKMGYHRRHSDFRPDLAAACTGSRQAPISVHGLRLFLPRGSSTVTAHRLYRAGLPAGSGAVRIRAALLARPSGRAFERRQPGDVDRGAP